MTARTCFAYLTLTALAACAPAPVSNDTAAFAQVACTELGFGAEDFGPGVECGWLDVPEDRGNAASRTLKIAVVVARALNEQAAEPVLYLHGGPGIATLDVTPRVLKGRYWPALRADHDLIFFDQRGTGRSKPALCPDFNAEMDAISALALAPREELESRVGAARACARILSEAGVDPSVYKSTEIARDAEALRQVLGHDRWNIYATSFGTLPAAEMIRRDPASVRALLLDSAFPPNSPNRAEQLNATAESFAAFQQRCDATPGCRDRYGDLRQKAARVAARLNAEPLDADGRLLDGSAFLRAVWVAQVADSITPFLAEFVLRAEAGDNEAVLSFLNAFGRNDVFGGYSHDQAWLVNCHDVFPRPAAPLIAEAIKAHPDLAGEAPADATDRMCAVLQPGSAPLEFYRPLETQVPTLVMFGEFDPATPRSDALAAMELLENGLLVEVAGASHAPFYQGDCTRSIGVSFFASPSVAPDTSCLSTQAGFRFADSDAFDGFLRDLGN